MLHNKKNTEVQQEKHGWISSAQRQGKKSDAKEHAQYIQLI